MDPSQARHSSFWDSGGQGGHTGWGSHRGHHGLLDSCFSPINQDLEWTVCDLTFVPFEIRPPSQQCPNLEGWRDSQGQLLVPYTSEDLLQVLQVSDLLVKLMTALTKHQLKFSPADPGKAFLFGCHDLESAPGCLRMSQTHPKLCWSRFPPRSLFRNVGELPATSSGNIPGWSPS